MKKTLTIMCLAALGCGYLVDESKGCETMQTNGFAGCRLIDTTVGFTSWAGCDERDAVAFDVSAVNSQGQRVSAVVCCGWPFKGCTVRTK